MAGDSKDTELRIRARDYSQKTLAQVVDALESLTSAQDEQIKSAQRGDTKLAALQQSYERIEQAAHALRKVYAEGDIFKLQSEALAQVTAAADSARKAQSDYAKTIGDLEKPTTRQTKELAKLARATKTAEDALTRAQDRLSKTTDNLAAYGVAVEDVASAQSQIRQSVAQANAALEKQDAAIESLDGALRKYRAGVKDAADAEAAAAKKSADIAAFTLAMQTQRFNEALQQIAAEDAARDKAAASRKQHESDLFNFNAAMQKQRLDEIAAQESVDAATKKEVARLRELGEQLAQTTRKYSALELARADSSGATSALRDIQDPAAAATRTLDGMGTALDGVVAKTKAINGPVRGAAKSFELLNAAQKQLQETAGNIDAYRKQSAAVRAAGDEYDKARHAAEQLAAQLAKGQGGSDVTQRVTAADAAVRRTSAELQKQTQRAAELKAALAAAGVDTNDLASAQQRLMTNATRTKDAMENLTAAVQKHGTAKEKTGSIIERFNKGGRESLSLFQRMRGEVLSLAASYGGLFAAISLVGEVVSVVQDTAKIENRLNEAFGGDTKAVAAEMEYLSKTANRLGLDLRSISLEYSKFLVATKGTTFTLQESRYVFEQFAEYARKSGQSSDEFSRTMVALTQVMSKGKIQAEELTGQLGESVPGALAKVAAGAKVSTETILKLMETGSLSVRGLIGLANELDKANNSAVDSEAQRLTEAVGRFETAKYEFVKAIAASGFLQAFSDFLNKLTTLMRSEKGKQFATAFGQAMSVVADILSWVVQNIDLVTGALKVWASLKVAGWITGFASGLRDLVKVARELVTPLKVAAGGVAAAGGIAATAASGFGVLSAAMGVFLRAIPFVGIAMGVWQIGSAILDQFTKSANDAADAKGRLGESGGGRKASGKVGTISRAEAMADMGGDGATPAPGTQLTGDDLVLADVKNEIAKANKTTENRLRAARAKGAKAELEARIAIAQEPMQARRAEVAKEIKDESKRAEALALIDKELGRIRLLETEKFNNERRKVETTAGAERAALVADIGRQMATVEDDIAKRATAVDPTASLDERIKTRADAIGNAYSGLEKKLDQLAKFDAKGAADAKAKLATYIAGRKEVETRIVQTEELARLEKQQADTQAAYTRELDEQKALFDAGRIGLDAYRDKTVEINNRFAQLNATQIEGIRAYAESIRSLLDPAQFDALISRLNVMRASNNPQQTNLQDRTNDADAKLNRLLDERKNKLAEIAQQQKVFTIGEKEAVARTNETNAAYSKAIVEQASVVDGLLAQQQVVMANNPVALAQLANMRAAVAAIVAENMKAVTTYDQWTQHVINSAASGINSTLESFVDIFGKMATGQTSLIEGFKGMAQAGMSMFADLLRQAALYIIKMQVIKALQAAGGTMGAIGLAMNGGVAVATKHTGGMAGAPSAGRTWLSAVPRMHGGGVAGLGLQNNEALRVLLKNEEVVTRDDPRHVLNGGGAARSQRFVLVDDRAKVPEAMASAEGDEVTMAFLRRNVASVKQLLNE